MRSIRESAAGFRESRHIHLSHALSTPLDDAHDPGLVTFHHDPGLVARGVSCEKMAVQPRFTPLAESLIARVEASSLATMIQGSTVLNGMLSGLHLVGLTLLLGSVLVTSVAIAGLIGPFPIEDLTRAARRASFWGLALSVVTGLLQVSPRVVAAVDNPTFRLKMALLVLGLVVLVGLQHPVARGRRPSVPPLVTAVLAVAVWAGVALAGLAFILLE
jgi:hypothetical protein